MKKLRICSILLIGLMLMGGTAWAYNASEHVRVAPNGKGDLIIFPWYFTAAGGWETKLTVINTSNTYSTVAKVVVRSHNWSEELLDFLIYLSPNDVWTGFLRAAASGTYLYSEDDSILRRLPAASGVVADDFASAANPVNFPLFGVTCTTTDSTNYGYVEVIEASATTGLTTIPGTNKVAKTVIYNWYSPLPVSPIPATQDILTGYQEFRNATVGMWDAMARGEVFAGWRNDAKLTTAAVTGLTSPSRNTIGELEAAMSKSDVSMPYINSANGNFSLHIFNFPTKLSWEESTCAVYNPYNNSPYFVNVGTKCEEYTPNVYDLLENTPTVSGSPFSGGDPGDLPEMCEEVELVATVFSGDVFREGWIRYNWATTSAAKTFVTDSGQPTSGNTFTGTPVLPVVLNFKASSASQAAAAHTDGVVTEGGAPYPFFQYSNVQVVD